MVFVLLWTGLQCKEWVRLNINQLSHLGAEELRQTERSQIDGVVGKGKTQRDVYLSLDLRRSLANCLEKEQSDYVTTASANDSPVLLAAIETAPRLADGRLAPRPAKNLQTHGVGVPSGNLKIHDLQEAIFTF